MSELEALRAATANSAKICGIEKTTGTIASGYQADLLVIDGKPDQNIRDLRKIQVVMKGGSIFRSDVSGLEAQGLGMPGVELVDGTFAKVY